jgi:hypothetical protein
MVHLRNLSNLKVLNLNQTAITDAGFQAGTGCSRISKSFISLPPRSTAVVFAAATGRLAEVLVAGGTSWG